MQLFKSMETTKSNIQYLSVCPSEGSLNTYSANRFYGAISGALMQMKTSVRSQTFISGDKSVVRELL